MENNSFIERVRRKLPSLRPAERRAARLFLDNPEEVLLGSASYLAGKAETSDATVIRTVRALGYSGMDEMRRAVAVEMRTTPSPSDRLARTIQEIGDEGDATTLDLCLRIHQQSLAQLRRNITPGLFEAAVDYINAAGRVFIFGIGPSSAMAHYFALQLGRFGLAAESLTETGILLADRLLHLKAGDLVLIFAYGKVYPELAALLGRVKTCGAGAILFSDRLGDTLHREVDMTLTVPRGKADLLSMHSATLALIEALLIGVAMRQPERSFDSLRTLNELRQALIRDKAEDDGGREDEK